MKKTAAILAALLLVAAALCGAAYPSPTSDFFVNDYAGVLSPDTKAYIMEQSASLAQETGAQIVVLTVRSLDGEDPASYALNVGRQWGIGDGEKDNGLLLLLAPDDGEIRVEVGRGLEGALNDAKVGRMIDAYALESYKAGDFDAGDPRALQRPALRDDGGVRSRGAARLRAARLWGGFPRGKLLPGRSWSSLS